MRKPDPIAVLVNGRPVRVAVGTTAAIAVLASGAASLRRSVSGEPRGPLCGMGVCFECRLTIDGAPHLRGCQIVCYSGMDIRTDG